MRSANACRLLDLKQKFAELVRAAQAPSVEISDSKATPHHHSSSHIRHEATTVSPKFAQCDASTLSSVSAATAGVHIGTRLLEAENPSAASAHEEDVVVVDSSQSSPVTRSLASPSSPMSTISPQSSVVNVANALARTDATASELSFAVGRQRRGRPPKRKVEETSDDIVPTAAVVMGHRVALSKRRRSRFDVCFLILL